MKKIYSYIIAAILLCMAGSASAQKYSLYYSRTLYDGIANPHHKVLDSCKSWGTNFFIPSFGADFSLKGDANKLMRAAMASENLTNYPLPNTSGANNVIGTNLNLNLFMLKVRVGRKRDAEWSLGLQMRTQASIGIGNGLFNFATQGNAPYLYQDLNGFMDLNGLVNNYMEASFGFRRQIYKKLSGGFKVSYLQGLANVTADIKDSKLHTTPDYWEVTLRGTARMSAEPDSLSKGDQGTLLNNAMNNKGFAFSGGLQYAVTRKLLVSAAVLDLGAITWNANSAYYKLDKTVRFEGVPALDSKAVQDSIFDNFSKFVVDSAKGSYTSPLLTRLEMSVNYKWFKWLNSTAVVSSQLYNNDIDFVFMTDLTLLRAVHFIALGAYNTNNYSTIGGQFLLRTRGLDFYVGSEKLLNTYQVTQQMADHKKKSSLALGLDVNFGMAFRFGHCPKKTTTGYTGPVDSDNDGVLDIVDECPFKAGPKENKGCPWPDTDGDGVLDVEDGCPTIAGPVENKGCPWPDSDGDGVPDKDDQCPAVAGPAASNGCPDTDGDGVYDKDDACPTVPGPKENLGCPYQDTDGDGVPDKDDQCPAVPGLPSLMGCPPEPKKVELTQEEQEVVNKVFSNLTFETGKAVITASSYPSLDALYELMIKKPTFKVMVEGHTDNVGKAAANKKLSEQRAVAVTKYMENKGIEGSRLIAKGYGSERPVADNKTPAGRAKNRRVEFTILE